MAKALKIAAVVVGVAALAVVTGGAAAGLGFSLATTLVVGGAYVSAGALLLAAGALSLGAALLAKKPSIPSAQTDRLTATVDPRAFRKTVLGSTAMATDVRYEEWYGKDQEFCAWVIALASHRIQGVDQIWLNDDLAWTATGGTQGKYVGYFSVPNIVTEGSAQTIVVGTSGKWDGSRRLTGCAYLHFTFRMTGLSKKAESPFASGGIPSRMTITGRGSPIYDPRRDSSPRAGGSGPMRVDDQSTWRYVTDDGEEIGENLALLILRVLLGWRISGKLATGCGIPAKRLNLASFSVAANLCSELVNRSEFDQPLLGADGTPLLGAEGEPLTAPGSTTEPRFLGAGVLSEGDDPRTAIDALCAACNGRLRDTGGRLSLVIMHNDLALAAADEGLTADDVIGPFTWNPDPSMESTANVVRGKYTDATANSLYQLLPYPDVSIPTNTGIERAMSLDLAVVESPSQAQRVAKQALQRRQYDRTFTAPFDIRAWKYPVGSPVPFTFAPLGFDRQLFRVAEQEVGPGGACNMTLSFETEEIYRWDADDRAPVRPAAAITYDPTKSALAQAIADADLGSVATIIQNSAPIEQGFITSSDNGDGTAKIMIAAHTRRYADKDVAVAAGQIVGLSNSTYYDIFYDDPGRTGGAVAYAATGTPPDARLSAAHPSRHYVGYVTTAAAGGASTGGGGATPPGGGYCVTATSLVMMADGTWKPAGDVRRGDRVRTRHEKTLEWGEFTVTATSVVHEQIMRAHGFPDATAEHRFWTRRKGWFRMADVGVSAGTAYVVRLTVPGAATYVARHPSSTHGVLSHNLKQQEQLGQ